MLRHVDLCSGIGGFAYAFETVGLSKPVLFCDIEPWSRQILSKHWPDVLIATDVKELANDPDGLVPDCDIITAGYPCQSFSVAGKRRGTEDDRHIWPYIFSIVQKKRCSWCIFENVLGHVTLGLDKVLSDLEGEGYATRPFVVPACATDAPHRRDRIFIICRNVADTDSKRLQGIRANNHSIRRKKQTERQIRLCSGAKTKRPIWKPQSSICGMADGIPHWLDEPGDIPRVSTGVPNRVQRLRGLGNSIVPQIAMRIGQTIKATYNA